MYRDHRYGEKVLLRLLAVYCPKNAVIISTKIVCLYYKRCRSVRKKKTKKSCELEITRRLRYSQYILYTALPS